MWKAHRTTVSRIFADSFIRQYTDVFAAKAMELVDNMNKYDFTKSFNVHYDVSRLSLDAIGITGFGYNFNSLSVNDPYYYDAATIVCEGAVMRTLMPISTIYHMLQAKNWRDSRAGTRLFINICLLIAAQLSSSLSSSSTRSRPRARRRRPRRCSTFSSRRRSFPTTRSSTRS